MENPICDYKVKKTVYDENFNKQHRMENYPIYRNDLKFRKARGIDVANLSVIGQHIENMDTLEYRMKECLEQGGNNLDLSNLELKLFPKNIPWKSILNIKRLFINNNDLEQIPDLSFLKKLEILDCSNNKLSEIPKLPNSIEEISCQSNKIKSVNFILDCPNLKRIDFSHNMIEHFPSNSNLIVAYLSFNKLTKIEHQPKLKRLSVNGNKIERIEKCHLLEELECRDNKLKTVVDFPNLKLLSCDNNMIDEIRDIPDIRFIQCTGNKLTVLNYFPKLDEIVCDLGSMKCISKRYKIVQYMETKDKLLILRFETR